MLKLLRLQKTIKFRNQLSFSLVQTFQRLLTMKNVLLALVRPCLRFTYGVIFKSAFRYAMLASQLWISRSNSSEGATNNRNDALRSTGANVSTN